MHGGKRQNSGRKKGSKTDVAKGLARTGAIKSAEEIIGSGQTPLEYLIETMRDLSLDAKTRLDAAKDAAPYVHCRKPQEVILQAEVHLEGLKIEFLGVAK